MKTSNLQRLAAVLTSATLVATPVVAAAKPAMVKTGTAKREVPPIGEPSHAVTNEIIDAIAGEMDRAMAQLEIPGTIKPYQIAYKVTEVEVNDVAASLGEVTSHRERHFVNLEARVRVGSLTLDNSNFVVPDADEIDGVAGINLPLEATPRIAARAAWLVTDQAYKEALVQLRAKIEARRAGSAAPTDLPSWTASKPVVSEDPVLVPKLESVDDLTADVKKVSAVFRGMPHIRDSRASATSYLERRWYLSTEGTSVTDTRRASGIVIAATAQADDGQELAQYFVRYGHTAADLPTVDALSDEARELANTLKALQTAPVLDRYSGPVLFEGEAAAEVARASLAPNLGGTPLPEGLRPQEAKNFGGGFTGRLGLRVLPRTMSVIDDPTAAALDGVAVIGGYKTDDEGVASQKVQVVKDGMLAALLTSRTPAQKGEASNGHARRSADGGVFHGSTTNLQITAKGGLARKALEAKLVAAAKGEGLGYGLLIKQIDDAAITAAPEYSRRELLQMLRTIDPDLPPPTVLAYRVLPGGKQELVRGVQLGEVAVGTWADILATGNTQTVSNYLAPSDSYLASKLTGGNDDGYVPSSGIESSVSTPDLLFKKLDTVPIKYGQRGKPAIPRPAP